MLRHSSSQGGAAAKNTSVAAARGEILASLDDDLWAPEYLEHALHVLDHQPELDLVLMGVTW